MIRNKILLLVCTVPLMTTEVMNFLCFFQIFAMDIGGSLTKIAYYSTLPLKKIVYDDQETVDDDAVYEVTEGARLHFIKFETKHIETTLDYIQKCLLGAETDMTVMDVKAE